MSGFDKALKFTLKWEGGYSNHPADKGGATNFGVTQKTYDSFRDKSRISRRSVREIVPTEVSEIYCSMFWNPIYAGALPEKIAIAYFDWAVNTGTSRAIKHLQGCLQVAEDGLIGPITLKAMARSHSGTLESFLLKREAFYRTIGKGKQAVFLKGWLNRLASLREYLGSL